MINGMSPKRVTDVFRIRNGIIKATSSALTTAIALQKPVKTNADSSSGLFHQSNTLNQIDKDALLHCLHRGLPYVQENFIDESEVVKLRNYMASLENEGLFKTVGLANRQRDTSGQTFGSSDRKVAALDSIYKMNEQVDSLRDISFKVNEMRNALSMLLKRPTLTSTQANHECYFSIYQPGAFLKRHLDEHHEALKGRTGYTSPSRRSISWLIYLSDENTQGGELRVFPQKEFIASSSYNLDIGIGNKGYGSAGASNHASNNDNLNDNKNNNYGDLQIGWLKKKDPINKSVILEPVYLDAWRNSLQKHSDEPSLALYILGGRSCTKNECVSFTREYITKDIQIATTNKLPSILTSSSSSNIFINPNHHKDFRLIEDLNLWETGAKPSGSVTMDIKPKRAQLVMFDSVALPHEVLSINGDNNRYAIAGWFHELTQQIPTQFT